jgi:hypothetical protein
MEFRAFITFILLGLSFMAISAELNPQECKIQEVKHHHSILLKNPRNASTRLSMNGKSAMMSTALRSS